MHMEARQQADLPSINVAEGPPAERVIDTFQAALKVLPSPSRLAKGPTLFLEEFEGCPFLIGLPMGREVQCLKNTPGFHPHKPLMPLSSLVPHNHTCPLLQKIARCRQSQRNNNDDNNNNNKFALDIHYQPTSVNFVRCEKLSNDHAKGEHMTNENVAVS